MDLCERATLATVLMVSLIIRRAAIEERYSLVALTHWRTWLGRAAS